jgi:hypothetical protein
MRLAEKLDWKELRHAYSTLIIKYKKEETNHFEHIYMFIWKGNFKINLKKMTKYGYG